MKTIKRGSFGEDVKRWQEEIGVRADGNFGPITEDVTKSWQAEHGLVADGIVGPQSWAAAGLLRLGNEVPVVRTVISVSSFASAFVRAWRDSLGDVPPKAAVAILWAHYIIETGNKSVWNWNIGNAKKTAYDGYDYHCLRGVWEGVTPTAAKLLIQSGQATEDKSREHALAVGPGRVSVIFNPPHPQSRFRAFASLEDGARHHMRLLGSRYREALYLARQGDVDGYARSLKAGGYMTATAESYARGMKPAYQDFMHLDAYENAIELLPSV